MEETHYKNLARLLISHIGTRHYFNGTVCSDTEESCITLCASLIIYREPLAGPDIPATTSRITNIVPVWWEFEEVGPDGDVSDDFSWSEFRPFLMGAI